MYKHGNMGNFTEKELIEILNKYGTLSDNGEETILDKILTSTDEKHEIKVSEIYDIPFEKEMAKCTIHNFVANEELEVEFEIGTKWDDNFYSSLNYVDENGNKFNFLSYCLIYFSSYRRYRRF